MRPGLVVFVDCLPSRSVGLEFLSELQGRASVRPGFGYSVNIVAELFAGLTPDDLGTFNVFSYKPRNAWLAPRAEWLRLLAPLRRFYFADRVAHRLLSLRAGYVGNIPFDYIGYFEPTGIYPFAEDFPHSTVFNHPGFEGARIFHSDLRGVAAPHRDILLIDRARDAIRPGKSIFLSLSDLDALAHSYGVHAPQFQQRIEEYDVWLAELIRRFKGANPDGYVAVVSDHGAEDTRGAVDLEVERHLGMPAPGRYVHFLDATLARFWVEDDAMRPQVKAFLQSRPHGALLREEERVAYGLTRRDFGDFIWVVDEGYAISPNFFGRRVSTCLHGYHPELPSQEALFLASEPLPEARYRSVDVHGVLNESLRLSESAADRA